MPVRGLCAARVRDGSRVQKGQTSHVELTTTHTPGLFILPYDPRARLSREVLLYIRPSYVPVMQHEPVSPSSGSWSQVLSPPPAIRAPDGAVGSAEKKPAPPGHWAHGRLLHVGSGLRPGGCWTGSDLDRRQASNLCETT